MAAPLDTADPSSTFCCCCAPWPPGPFWGAAAGAAAAALAAAHLSLTFSALTLFCLLLPLF